LGDPISLLIYLLVLVLVCYVLFWILGQVPMPQPVRVVVTGVIALIALVYLLRQAGLL